VSTALSKEIKGSTSAVSEHHKAFDRAREVYLMGIKRLEAEYFQRIKQASAQLMEAPPSAPAPSNSHAAEAAQPAE
jgi:hypothetical protein